MTWTSTSFRLYAIKDDCLCWNVDVTAVANWYLSSLAFSLSKELWEDGFIVERPDAEKRVGEQDDEERELNQKEVHVYEALSDNVEPVKCAKSMGRTESAQNLCEMKRMQNDRYYNLYVFLMLQSMLRIIIKTEIYH